MFVIQIYIFEKDGRRDRSGLMMSERDEGRNPRFWRTVWDSNRSPGLARDPSRLQERHLPTPLQIYDGIINNNKFVANLYKAK